MERGSFVTSSLTTLCSSPGEEASSSPPHLTNDGRQPLLAADSSSGCLKDQQTESLSSSKWPRRNPRQGDFLP
ncbi:UNVERIFIED_CONTAM: hypothetical protein Sradi_5752200 [Sesamum radiatum]|uniref:Uncharacterized protein n=1 Tax=Sesamum radiatum TaxID=300843 RepID=A0AAW2L2I8_SESRA